MPPSDEQIRQIGRITMNFAALETYAQTLVWMLVGADQWTGLTLTTNIGFRRLLPVIDSLARQRFESEQPVLLHRILAFTRDAGAVMERRNSVVHSVWLGTEGDQRLTRLKFTLKRAGLQPQAEDFTTRDMQALADEVMRVAEEIVGLYDPIVAAYPDAARGRPHQNQR